MASFRVSVSLLVVLTATTADAQRNLKDIPDPDPEIERKSFIVADGFEVNLFASDPKIAKPIQMNFDPKGRLWIASSEVYPHIKPGQKANDKVLVLEDTDGDGKSDKTTVFADGLLIPTGVLPGDGGVYVANSTELLHFADTNGDGKADKKRIVLSGFGTEDTHHILHTLRWGPGGQLYMNQSIYIHSHIETPYGVRRLNAGGIWRFRPETLQLQVLARGWYNSWGHQVDAYGQSFATDGAGGEGINFVVPGASYPSAFGAQRILHGLNPGSPKYCGLEIVGGRHLPKEWDGNIITNDFRGNRVCRFVLSDDGSGFAAKQQEDLIKTKHVAFRPIDIKMGPDGAIYIADWYNPIIQHGEVDFRDPRRDHVHGRIWRVTRKGSKTVPRPKLVGATVPQLLDNLKSPEMWTRHHAKRVLKERKPKDVLPALRAWTKALDPKDPLYDRHRLEALWVHQSHRDADWDLLESLTKSQDYRVRAGAIRVLGYWLEPGQTDQSPEGADAAITKRAMTILAAAVSDDHPRVRLDAVCVLRTISETPAMETAIRVLDKPVDKFLDYALWQTARELQSEWLPAVQSGKTSFGGRADHLAYALKAVGSPSVVSPLVQLLKENKIPAGQQTDVLAVIAGVGGPNELRMVFDTAMQKSTDNAKRAALLSALATATQQRRIKPSGILQTVNTLFKAESQPVRIAAIRCAGVWKLSSLRGEITAIAADAKESEPVRANAIAALGNIPGAEALKSLVQLSARSEQPAIRERAVIAICNHNVRLAAIQAVKLLDTAENRNRTEAVVTELLSRRQGPADFAAALNSRKIPKDTAIIALRTVSGSGRSFPALEAALKTAGGIKTGPVKLTPEQMQQRVAEVRKSGSADRGEAIFRRKQLNCMKCHAIGGAGGRVGPDLASIGGSAQIDYLIESLLEPNKKIKENYQTLVVADEDGKIHTGIKVRQSDKDLILRDAEDREIAIPLKSIEFQRNGTSMMPAGLTEQLTRQEINDLVRFLSELGKVGKFSVSRDPVVRRWHVLADTPEARFRLRRTSYQTASSDDPALSWESAYSTVGGELPLAGLPELKFRNGTERVAFVRFELTVSQAGPFDLTVNDPAGLEAWLGMKPQTLGTRTRLNLPAGTHRFTIAVHRKNRKSPLRIGMADVPGSKARVQFATGK